MSQLIENKRNDPILIANFEPNEIATQSEEKTKIQTRKHCAGNAAHKVKNQSASYSLTGEACSKAICQAPLRRKQSRAQRLSSVKVLPLRVPVPCKRSRMTAASLLNTLI